MNNQSGLGAVPEHDVKSIVKGLIIALILGVIVVVTIVWPAEYGKDPTGIGAFLGLTRMTAEELAAAEARPVDLNAGSSSSANDATTESASVDAESKKAIPIPVWPLDDMEVAQSQNIQIRQTAFRSENAEVTLQTGEAMEFKVELSEGEPLMFSWAATGGEIYTDLHAEPTVDRDSYPEHYFYRYDEREDTNGHGRFKAPFTGTHGWYLLNRNDSAVTVSLEISGFYRGFKAIEKEAQKPAN